MKTQTQPFLSTLSRLSSWPPLLGATALLLLAVQPAKAAVIEAWVQRYNGPSNRNDYATAVAVDGSGNVVVTGYSGHYDSRGYPLYDCYMAKYAATNGAVLWEKRIMGTTNGDAVGWAVAVDGSGNVVMTGGLHNGTNDDFYTAKYAAADGALLWEKHYNGPANLRDYATALALDGDGNAIVTGVSKYSDNMGDYGRYTAKYAAVDGALLWENRFDGTQGGTTSGSAIAVDSGGNAVVTGSSYSGTNYDFYTAKYAAADGALLWEKRYNGPANLDDSAGAVAVDSSGNVVVAGGSSRSQFRSDYYTAKYAGTNGALIWERRYSGPTNALADSTSAATAVALDASGNVIVTGSSSAFSNYDFYTAKYAAADGALLWEKRYAGPDEGNDQARAVALDRNGNVVVTGSTAVYDGSFNRNDYYTAKHAAADGALLWEKFYNGPAKGDDAGLRLALTPYGRVIVTGVSDGNFDPTSTDYDYLTVVYQEPLPPVSIGLVPAGVRIRSTGTPGLGHRLQRAAGVSGSWATIATPLAAADGLIEFIDTMPPTGAAFYRMSAP